MLINARSPRIFLTTFGNERMLFDGDETLLIVFIARVLVLVLVVFLLNQRHLSWRTVYLLRTRPLLSSWSGYSGEWILFNQQRVWQSPVTAPVKSLHIYIYIYIGWCICVWAEHEVGGWHVNVYMHGPSGGNSIYVFYTDPCLHVLNKCCTEISVDEWIDGVMYRV